MSKKETPNKEKGKKTTVIIKGGTTNKITSFKKHTAKENKE
jgi:hypothetical protein